MGTSVGLNTPSNENDYTYLAKIVTVDSEVEKVAGTNSILQRQIKNTILQGDYCKTILFFWSYLTFGINGSIMSIFASTRVVYNQSQGNFVVIY